MNRFPFPYSLVCALGLVCLSAAPARAQRASGPFAGLFGGNNKDQAQSLDFRASLFSVFDQNILGGVRDELSLPPDERFQKSGIASGLTTSLGYSRRASRAEFQLSGDTSIRRFGVGANVGDLWVASYNAGTSFTTALNSKTTFGIQAVAEYAPFYQFAPFLKIESVDDSPVAGGYDLAVISTRVQTLGTSASISNRFSRRSSISADVGWNAQRVSTDTQGSLGTGGAHVAFTHQITRGLGVRLGYGIQQARYTALSDTRPVINHNLDIGVNYGDGLGLTFARRYTLTFSFGGSVVRSGRPADVVTTTDKVQTAFHIDGSATLARAIGRTWSASVGYARGTQFIGAFREPLFTDSVNAGIGGLLARRLQFGAGGGYSRGRLAFSSGSGYAGAYSGSAKLTYGVTPSVGLFVQYAYYKYTIPPGFTTIAFLPGSSRQTLSVGLSCWVPLIGRQARP